MFEERKFEPKQEKSFEERLKEEMEKLKKICPDLTEAELRSNAELMVESGGMKDLSEKEKNIAYYDDLKEAKNPNRVKLGSQIQEDLSQHLAKTVSRNDDLL